VADFDSSTRDRHARKIFPTRVAPKDQSAMLLSNGNKPIHALEAKIPRRCFGAGFPQASVVTDAFTS
jgi:hypothetical protein